MNQIVTLSWQEIAAGYFYILALMALLRRRRIPREKELLVATVRMTLQLIIVGYLLIALFDNPSPWISVGVLAAMEVFAIRTMFKKFEGRLSRDLRKIIAIAMIIGTLGCLVFLLLWVLPIRPWYNPQYLIPISGMLVGNTMTGISLALHSLLEGMVANRAIVEEALILGATPRRATDAIVNQAFDGAITPTLQSMLGMGIVFLPGMMTGQILSGVLPTTAIAYQIVIMLGILGCVSASVMLLLKYGVITFFNQEKQLID